MKKINARKSLLGLVLLMVFGLLAGVALTRAPSASHAAAPIVFSFQVGDRGPGGWGGGNGYPDGTLNGSGKINFATSDGVRQMAQIDVKDSTWKYTDATDSVVNFCFIFIGQEGYIFPPGSTTVDCTISVPVDKGHVQVGGAGDPDLWGMVNTHPSN